MNSSHYRFSHKLFVGQKVKYDYSETAGCPVNLWVVLEVHKESMLTGQSYSIRNIATSKIIYMAKHDNLSTLNAPVA